MRAIWPSEVHSKRLVLVSIIPENIGTSSSFNRPNDVPHDRRIHSSRQESPIARFGFGYYSFFVNLRPKSPVSIAIVSRGLNSLLMSPFAKRLSTSDLITRFRGRAPYTGSKPFYRATLWLSR